jgi:uncharacterized membrane protein
MGTATGYIPEQGWNESAVNGGSGLRAGGGGASAVYPKPWWQTGAGVAGDDGRRDVPDVSLAAAQHDGYQVYFGGSAVTVSGTSAGAPALAAMLALVNEKAGGRQGNVNSTLYRMALNGGASGDVFHDVTAGNNSVPGVSGYSAGTSYDLATGLGSVNGAALVESWSSANAPPSCTLAAADVSLTVTQKQSASTTLGCVGAQGLLSRKLALSVAGLPAGVTAQFSPEGMLNPGSGARSLIVSAGANAKPGTYHVTVSANGANSTAAFVSNLSMALTVNTPTTFVITPSVTSLSMPQGSSGTVTLTSVHSGSFNSAITFQTSGLPSTVTTALSASVIPAPGDGTITITLSALSMTTPGSYTMLVVAQGGGLTLKIPITVLITVAPAFKLTASAAAMTLREPYVPSMGTPIPNTATVTLTSGTLTNGFNLPVMLTVGTLPTGVTASFSPSTLAAPGSGTSTLTLSIAGTATTGVSTFTVTATGGTITREVNVQLTVTPPPTFSLSATYPSYTLMAGSSMSQTISSTPLYGYNSNIQLTTTLPAGVIASLSATSIRGAYGTSTITIQPAATLAAGTYQITVTGTDAVTGNAETVQISLIVASVATTVNPTPVIVAAGASVRATVTTVATSYTGNVVLSLAGIPAGVSATFSPTSIVGGSGSSTLTLLVSSYAGSGNYLITLKSSAAGVVFTSSFTLSIE